MPFNIKFDLANYKHILPNPEEYTKHDEIINADHYEKGNIDSCIWQRKVHTEKELSSPWFKEREITRILKTGVWICIKDEIVWIPPNYYFGLQYGKAGAVDMQFRLKRLKQHYFKIEARKNEGCIGTLTIKNRGDGETTSAVTDAFWECLDGNMDVGQIGIQSKTRNDVINPCWGYVQTLWQNQPQWLKNELSSDFASGDNTAEKMLWKREANELLGIPARFVLFKHYPSGTPMDGNHDVKICLLDEVCKWEETETFSPVFINYKKFIMPGFERRGMFNMFSSPADKDIQSNREVQDLWGKSDPTKITANGTTESRIHRYHSDPLEGIHGAYDKWGDVDPQRIYDKIMADRAAVKPEDRLKEVRGFPLNEEEMFGSFEGGDVWDNVKGIKQRKVYLLSARFKDEVTKEPIKVYGNLEWKDGIIDHADGPVFRQADTGEFDVQRARFCFSYENLPNKVKLTSIFKPPLYVESVLGVDPFGKRYPGKRNSNGAAVNWKFLDMLNTGIYKCPTMTYCNRPFHEDIFFEDMIKAAVFNQAMVQFENVHDRIAGYFEDRGYHAWLMPSIGEKLGSFKTGDAPNTLIKTTGNARGNSFLDEGVRLLNAIMNLPLNPGDPYLLERNYHAELLEDALKLNLKDTHENDLTMAWIQAVVGAIKLMYKKTIEKSQVNNRLVGSFIDAF